MTKPTYHQKLDFRLLCVPHVRAVARGTCIRRGFQQRLCKRQSPSAASLLPGIRQRSPCLQTALIVHVNSSSFDYRFTSSLFEQGTDNSSFGLKSSMHVMISLLFL
jgi:hypothetical protein